MLALISTMPDVSEKGESSAAKAESLQVHDESNKQRSILDLPVQEPRKPQPFICVKLFDGSIV